MTLLSQDQLRSLLLGLDGQSYKAYKSLQGAYDCGDFTLYLDYIQGDPFAAPSQARVWIPQSVAQFPTDLYRNSSRAVALADYLTRQFYQATRGPSPRRGSGKSGLIEIVRPSQAVLGRSAAQVSEAGVELRFTVGLPAFGRRIVGRQAAELLGEDVPDIVLATACYGSLSASEIERHVTVIEDGDWLRSHLETLGLVAFVADGAILPRRSGVDERPLLEAATPFQSPESLRVMVDLPNGGRITGMGIPQGITLIVGGGYHGKSTLLKALEMGIYNHIPGDGREYVVADPSAFKVRAEDGRSVTGVDISPFINHLPQGKSTCAFSTSNASGSTSQAANIMEALEVGAKVLLVDEDTSATNFMIRDRRMQALIAKDREPITPFVDKVRQLWGDHGVSTVLVMGGSGDYFDMADTVIALDSYVPQDVTAQAQAIAAKYRTDRATEGGLHFGRLTPRRIRPQGIDPSQGKRDVKLKVRSTDEIRFGTEEIDLSAVEQLVEPGQARAIAVAIVHAQRHYLDGQKPLAGVLDAVLADLKTQGLDCLDDRRRGDLVYFRALELAAALNRLRTLQVVI
ncbi:ABC-ATPase domain-containing protein [Leptolyngbya sp. PCC 6406]|uniref:ABC-ATPase domain-containing protein n=1 Tax=Leptolyngbya sp. PCC 6406 TaxID=1173264 RepID=UPI0002ACC415|nr:ABC-ATPase domain-containing protein [Leptolyngbya sp. PCC 6406]